MSGEADSGASGEERSVCGVRLRVASGLRDPAHDALVVVVGPAGAAGEGEHASPTVPAELRGVLDDLCRLDNALLTEQRECVSRWEGVRVVCAGCGAGVASPYEDVRAVREATRRGVQRALAAGARAPALLLQRWPRWPTAPLVALLAALEALYVPLQQREEGARPPAEALGVVALPDDFREDEVRALLRDAAALEAARAACRDVGGADPERMSPARVAHYAQALFPAPHSPVAVRVLTDADTIRAQYPLFAAVSRAADSVSRHRGCIVFLEYVPESYDKTVMLVGKGVTYDTGGCDIKVGGAMAGMSRDKCGAAAVIGFFKACSSLRPALKAVGAVAAVRNSVGEEAYVADEVLRSARGLRVRVGNTDAEGRLVMADLLAEMAVRAAGEVGAHLYTIATLTGHAALALGPYTGALDNHAAGRGHNAERLRAAGGALGDALEVSTIRREDLAAHRGKCPGDHLHQGEARPSTRVPRGHQGPAAFLLLAASLDAPGAPPYTHLDIAGSAGDLPHLPTAAPLLALAAHLGMLASLPQGGARKD